MSIDSVSINNNIRGLRQSFTRDEYVSPEVFDHEMQEIFAKRWNFVGRAEQLNHVGDRLVVEVGNESILIVRNREGELRAYYNVCQHRGSQLCDKSGSGFGAAITCPYHSWSYSLEGKLVSAIHHDKESFDRDGISLTPVRVDEWQGNMFVCLSDDEEALHEWLEGLYSKPFDLDKFEIGKLKVAYTTVDEAKANWKVLVENYCECLHCSVVHPEFCEIVPVYGKGFNFENDRFDNGVSLAPGMTAVSFKQNEGLPTIATMDDLDNYSVFGAYVYPNMLIDVNPTLVAVTSYIPRSPNHTTVITTYLFPAEVIGNPVMDIMPAVEFNDLVNHQDIDVSERVQRGVASKSFKRAYHSEMEKYAQRFVKQYRQDITNI